MSFKAAHLFQTMQKYIGFIDVLDALAEPTYDHQVNRKKTNDPQTSATAARALRRQKKRAPRCMGAFRPKNGRQKMVPKKRSKAFKINAFQCFFGAGHAEVTPNDLSATLHGNAIFQKSVENTNV